MNKVVISGGASGIGFELAKILSERGDKVYSLDINKPEIEISGVTNIIADVTNANSLSQALTDIGQGINILINNAGIMRRGNIFDTKEEDFDLLFKINVKGSWLLLKEAKSYLERNATIVQMSSRHALYPPKDPAVYGLCKQMVAIMAQNIQEHYPEYKIKLLFPGSTDTPLSRFGVSGEALQEKLKIMHSTNYVANKIVELIDSDKTCLIFKPENRTYVIE